MRSIHGNREQMQARLFRAALMAVAALELGCGKPTVAPPLGTRREVSPHRGGTFRGATFVDMRTLDPAVAFDEATKVFTQLLFESLIDYDRQGRIVGRLAERFAVSDDGLRFDFHLRPGLTFQDGTPITAEDVKRSVERTLAHETPCPAPTFYSKIKGYSSYHDGMHAGGGPPTFAPELIGVVVDGPHDVHIELAEQDATFLAAMTLPFMAPVCKTAGRAYGHDWQFHPCGAGPFRLDSWEQGQRIRLVRNEHYMEPDKPRLDAVEWYLSMAPLTERFKFESGEIDTVYDLSEPDGVAYRQDARWAPYGQWDVVRNTFGVFMNTQMAPFDNVELRRAVAAVIDWDQITSVRSGNVVTIRQLVPPVIAEYDPPFAGQTHDESAALDHMRKAGYVYDPQTKRGGYPGTVRFEAYAEGFPAVAGEVLAQQLAHIGITIELKIVSWPTFLAETTKRRRVQLGVIGWSMDFPDPSDFFEPILSTEAIQEEESQNAAFFSDPQLDGLLRTAHAELDLRKRKALYGRCEEIIRDDAPWAIGFAYRYLEVTQPYVHDYVVDVAHPHFVRDVWIDEDEKARATGRRGNP